MEPLGKLLQRMTTDTLRTSQSVDAVGTSERMRYQHAEALLQLLRNAVLARDWPRAAGASPPRAPRAPARLTPTAALASVGLQATSTCTLPHEKAMQRKSDASFQLMQLVRGWRVAGRTVGAHRRPHRQRRCAGSVASPSKATWRPPRTGRPASAPRCAVMRWWRRLRGCSGRRRWQCTRGTWIVRDSSLHAPKTTQRRHSSPTQSGARRAAVVSSPSRLTRHTHRAAAIAAVTPANASSTQRVALQLRTAALPLLKEAAAASPEDELLKGALACIAGPRRRPIPGQEEDEEVEEQ